MHGDAGVRVQIQALIAKGFFLIPHVSFIVSAKRPVFTATKV